MTQQESPAACPHQAGLLTFNILVPKVLQQPKSWVVALPVGIALGKSSLQAYLYPL